MFSALPQLWVEVLRRGRGGEPSTLGIYLLSALLECFSFPSRYVHARGHNSRLMYIFESIFILIAFRRSLRVFQVTHFNRAPRCGKTCIIWIVRSALQQSSAISISLRKPRLSCIYCIPLSFVVSIGSIDRGRGIQDRRHRRFRPSILDSGNHAYDFGSCRPLFHRTIINTPDHYAIGDGGMARLPRGGSTPC